MDRPAPTFPADRLAAVGAAEEVDIETRAGPDAPSHRTTIWVVVENGDVFVRSVRGTRGRWYQEVTANPDAMLWLAREAIAVRAAPATDEASVERCSRGLRRKYGSDPALRTMLRPDTLPTTLRLEPR
jgi:hypothetical protein